MIKHFYKIVFLLFLSIPAKSQQYGLYQTGTLFDTFENPASEHFKLDYSRKYSTNLFLPIFGASINHNGPANDLLRNIVVDGKYDSSLLPLGVNKNNRATVESNAYLFGLKIYNNYKTQQEIGLSWQIKSDANLKYKNDFLAFINDYNHLDNQVSDDIFNSKITQQAYQQFSISYREDIDKKLAIGIKLSYLKGIISNHLEIKSSSINIDKTLDTLQFGLLGSYKASYLNGNEINIHDFINPFRNPGISITTGFQYKTPTGYVLMGNIKDLGFIKWSKNSYNARLNNFIGVNTAQDSDETSNDISDKLKHIINENKGGYVTTTNAKVDFYLSKYLGYYTPALLLSKNIFNSNGDIAFINNFALGNFSVAVTPTYNLNKYVLIGLQGMYKTPNFEIYGGSDNFIKSAELTRSVLNSQGGKRYLGASFYAGMSFKFGKIIQHPLNSDHIPGIEDPKLKGGFLRNIFRKK